MIIEHYRVVRLRARMLRFCSAHLRSSPSLLWCRSSFGVRDAFPNNNNRIQPARTAPIMFARPHLRTMRFMASDRPPPPENSSSPADAAKPEPINPFAMPPQPDVSKIPDFQQYMLAHHPPPKKPELTLEEILFEEYEPPRPETLKAKAPKRTSRFWDDWWRLGDARLVYLSFLGLLVLLLYLVLMHLRNTEETNRVKVESPGLMQFAKLPSPGRLEETLMQAVALLRFGDESQRERSNMFVGQAAFAFRFLDMTVDRTHHQMVKLVCRNLFMSLADFTEDEYEYILFLPLHLANTYTTEKQLSKMMVRPERKERIQRIKSVAPLDLLTDPIMDLRSYEYLWGFYLASADVAYLKRIVSCIDYVPNNFDELPSGVARFPHFLIELGSSFEWIYNDCQKLLDEDMLMPREKRILTEMLPIIADIRAQAEPEEEVPWRERHPRAAVLWDVWVHKLFQ